MTAQTISADLAAITAHNQQVRSRNDARQQLAVLGAQMDRLGAPFYASYRARRAGSIAQFASDKVSRGPRLAAGPPMAARPGSAPTPSMPGKRRPAPRSATLPARCRRSATTAR